MTDNTSAASILSYRVSLPAAIIFAIAYIALGAGLLFRARNNQARWGYCLGIGAVCQGIGFLIRIVYRFHQDSVSLYALQQLIIVVSPAAYFAFNYIVFGRLAYNLVNDKRIKSVGRLTLLRPEWVSRFFVMSDVVTFVIQLAGGGMQSIQNLRSVGNGIFLAGIIVQLVSYLIYLGLFARMRIFALPKLCGDLAQKIDRILLLIAWSSIFIVMRSIFRTLELAEGYDGKLFQTEVYFLVLDALPLWIAIFPYIILWPGSILSLKREVEGYRSEQGYAITGHTLPLSDLEPAQTPDK